MEDIQTRLQETSQNCLKAFAEWDGKKKDRKAQEDLHAAIHELRKVSSRLEIELAVSERDQVTSKPLPIPAHRSNSKGVKAQGDNEFSGNHSPADSKPKVPEIKQRKRRKPAEGGSAE
ncbi:MAG: hypothetical protein ACRBDI_02535 [Alphaproteobacteria bacterium]